MNRWCFQGNYCGGGEVGGRGWRGENVGILMLKHYLFRKKLPLISRIYQLNIDVSIIIKSEPVSWHSFTKYLVQRSHPNIFYEIFAWELF